MTYTFLKIDSLFLQVTFSSFAYKSYTHLQKQEPKDYC